MVSKGIRSRCRPAIGNKSVLIHEDATAQGNDCEAYTKGPINAGIA